MFNEERMGIVLFKGILLVLIYAKLLIGSTLILLIPAMIQEERTFSDVWEELRKRTKTKLSKFKKRSELTRFLDKEANRLTKLQRKKKLTRSQKDELATYKRGRTIMRRHKRYDDGRTFWQKTQEAQKFTVKQKSSKGKWFERSYQQWEDWEVTELRRNPAMSNDDMVTHLQKRFSVYRTSESVRYKRRRLF